MTQRQGLYRSRTDRVFGGVAGGIARSLNTDPAIVRIVFALLIIFGGGGLLLYLILWIAIPEEPLPIYNDSGEPVDPYMASNPDQAFSAGEPEMHIKKRNDGALIIGLILIAFGVIFLADRLLPRIHLNDFWPVIIIVAGLALIFSSVSSSRPSKP